MTWADAELTDIGIQQAQIANDFWRSALSDSGISPPVTYYVSPLNRCLETARVTFSGLDLPKSQPFIPTVKELLREGIGIHTCDRRSSRSWIASHYPEWPIEEGFVEHDQLWLADLRESDSAHVVRMRALLDDVFAHDDSTWISLTSHSGSIRAILAAVGHQQFPLATGAIIPVFIKAEWVDGLPPPDDVEPWQPAPTCNLAQSAPPTA